MTTPFLSFISAVYNKADVLAETLDCLRSQAQLSNQDVEFVFVDDGSSDGSLDILKQEAALDKRITVISDGQNLGPSIRFNQAAKAANGHYLLAIDADDLLPANAAFFMAQTAQKQQAQVVFGRSKRHAVNDVLDCPLVDPDSTIIVPEDPLGFAAQKKIVRMGILCERDTWLKAGGANENIFIQDQSLPLRLSLAANRIAYVENYVYFLRPTDQNNLSSNILQQHHDRFFALSAFLQINTISSSARKAIMQQVISSLWKIERDSRKGLAYFSPIHFYYLLNKLIGKDLSSSQIRKAAHKLQALSDIRRPVKE